MDCWLPAERLLAADGRRRRAVPHLRFDTLRGRVMSDSRPRSPQRPEPDRARPAGSPSAAARRLPRWPTTSIEAVVAITAGVVAGSVALVGFGLDSVVEVSSGLIILWQFRHRLPETGAAGAAADGALVLRLAAYVTFESVRALLGGARAGRRRRSASGWPPRRWSIMPFLSWAQRRTGQSLGLERRGRRLHPDAAVHLPVRGAAGRPAPQRHPGLVVGRPARWPGHRRRRGAGGPRGMAR